MSNTLIIESLSKCIDSIAVYPPRPHGEDGVNVLDIVQIGSNRPLGDMIITTGQNMTALAHDKIQTEYLIDKTDKESEPRIFSAMQAQESNFGIGVGAAHVASVQSRFLKLQVEDMVRTFVNPNISWELEKLLRDNIIHFLTRTSLQHSVQKRFCLAIVMGTVHGRLSSVEEESDGFGIQTHPLMKHYHVAESPQADNDNDVERGLSITGVIGVKLLCFAIQSKPTEIKISKSFKVVRPVDKSITAIRSWMRGPNPFNFIKVMLYKEQIFKAHFVQGTSDFLLESNPELKEEFQSLMKTSGSSMLGAHSQTNSSEILILKSLGGLRFSDLWDGQLDVKGASHARFCLVLTSLSNIQDIFDEADYVTYRIN